MLFPGFFLGGFDCSTPVDRSGTRRDWVSLTQHDVQFRADYERAQSTGIRAIHEGVRWYLWDRGGTYDFSSIQPMVEAAEDLGIMQINCLFHYGSPDGLDPLDPGFAARFRDFCAAFAAWRKERVAGPRW